MRRTALRALSYTALGVSAISKARRSPTTVSGHSPTVITAGTAAPRHEYGAEFARAREAGVGIATDAPAIDSIAAADIA